MDIESISNFVSIVISSFLGIHFLSLGGKSNRADTFLGLFLIFTTVSVLDSELYPLDPEFAPFQWIFPLGSPYLTAPTLLYYALGMTNSLDVKGRKYAWAFLPAVVDILLRLIFPELGPVADISTLLSSLFSLYIFYLILQELRLHNRAILNVFSTIEDKKLNWLRGLIATNIGFALLWLLDDSLQMFWEDNPISPALILISLFATLITILWIGFAGLRQERIYVDVKEEEKENPVEQSATIPDLDRRYRELVERIEEGKLYLDKDLTLGELAKAYGMRNRELSQLINQGFGENFYHFINHFRVGYYKTLLDQPKYRAMSIEGLSLEAGFNSKSTFYAAFKKVEGMTPKQFQQGLK